MKRPIALIAAAISLAALPVLAEDASTSDVYACKDITTDPERLACYDAAVGRLQAAEEAGEVKTFTRTEVEEVQRDSFGFSIPSLPKLAFGGKDDNGKPTSDELKEVTFPVKAIGGDRGALIVTLDNGQVWRQVDNKKISPLPKKEARVYQAALGSFKMKLDGGLAFRVERVK